MSYFILSILLNIGIYQIFRQAGRNKIDLFGILLTNYLTCVAIGLSVEIGFGLSYGQLTWPPAQVGALSLGLGIIFLSCFYLLARFTAHYGAGAAGVVSRVSMVLPVLFFHLSQDEPVSFLAWLGIALALISPWLLLPLGGSPGAGPRFFFFAFLVFIGYGSIDIGLKITESMASKHGVLPRQLTLYIFTSACAAGWLVKLASGKITISKPVWKWGLALGLVNFFSIFLFIKALPLIPIPLSLLFPLNGILILLGATLVSVWLFGERLTKKAWLGAAIAVLAIALMSV
ncbi:MAG: hypothetical protein HYZ16_00095 [Bacteroidetes bacterium]|nr:hypothetical protein [Bacteroidota bacterium]